MIAIYYHARDPIEYACPHTVHARGTQLTALKQSVTSRRREKVGTAMGGWSSHRRRALRYRDIQIHTALQICQVKRDELLCAKRALVRASRMDGTVHGSAVWLHFVERFDTRLGKALYLRTRARRECGPWHSLDTTAEQPAPEHRPDFTRRIVFQLHVSRASWCAVAPLQRNQFGSTKRRGAQKHTPDARGKCQGRAPLCTACARAPVSVGPCQRSACGGCIVGGLQ